jgi:hypothetical protein
MKAKHIAIQKLKQAFTNVNIQKPNEIKEEGKIVSLF